MTIRINDPHSVQIIMQAARVAFVPQLHHCIAEYTPSDRLMGGVLFTDWNYGSVLMHFALFEPRGGLGRQLLWLAFQYPFNQLGVKKVFCLVPEWNILSRNVCLRLGFKIEYKVDDVFNNPPPIDNGMYIISMKRENCKWLTMKPPHITFALLEQTNRMPILTPREAPLRVTYH